MDSSVCAVTAKVQGRKVMEGAGVKVNRLIATSDMDNIDPFVLLDEFKSENPEDYIAGFPMHPHRGIETITYMLSGAFRHKDSRGGGGLLTDGCVQWMTAGRGIQHSEMPERTSGLLHGFQLWLNLPAKEKMTPPKYQHLSPQSIPEISKDGIKIKLISGDCCQLAGSAENVVKTKYFDIMLKSGRRFEHELDSKMNSFIYVYSGSVTASADNTPVAVDAGELARFEPGLKVQVYGKGESAQFIFCAAMPNNEPIARGGPFVMNTREEIVQAFEDYKNGKLF